MLSIQTNIASLVAQQNFNLTSDFQSKTIQAVTSGYRINQSGDDAAGLVAANSYRNSVAELTQGARNANDAVSTLQIADGGMGNISKMLDRLKTLATQAENAGSTANLDAEYQSILTEIDREAGTISSSKLSVYIGGGSTVDIDLSKQKVDTTGLALNGTALDTAAHITAAMSAITAAVGKLGDAQGAVGAGQNTLQYAINLANSQITNQSAAESRIRDADMASEAASLTKAQVLQQASLAAMAQANAAPQAVLTLLKG